MATAAWGLVDLTLITIGVAGTLWVVAHASEVIERGARWTAAFGIGPGPAPHPPDGMPIERIAADLRRIRPQARWPAEGMPMVRRRAITAAYDEALLDACRALDVPTELGRIADALELESERLRTEAALEAAGVDLG